MATILITGGSGLIGTALTRELLRGGHQVRHLGRQPDDRPGVRGFQWDISRNELQEDALQGVDHIVHLAGAGIADKRWSAARVKELIASRAASALLLLRVARRSGTVPKSFVSAAGINYYGAISSDHLFTEQDLPGNDTIGQICQDWEAAVDEWANICRVVKLRTPVVLSARGGALAKLVMPVRAGMGAALGSGRQWMPWVHLDDLVAAYVQALFNEQMQGPYNVSCGQHVTNIEFMRTVAKVLDRPFFLPPVPGFMLKLALGRMSSILLEGSRASNQRLLGTGFRFMHTDLKSALLQLLVDRK